MKIKHCFVLSPSATNSHTTWDQLLEWETEQDKTGTDDTEDSDNEEEEESITATPISKLRKGSTRRLDISTQLPPLSQNESKIAEIKNITTTKHIHNTTTSLQISKIESKKVRVTTTIYSSSTPQSTSKSRMPYNIFSIIRERKFKIQIRCFKYIGHIFQ